MPPTPSAGSARERLAQARLCLLATPGVGPHGLVDAVSAALRGGVDVVQLREKTREDAALIGIAEALHGLCREHGALFIVNDRIGLAAAVGADGVHLGQDDATVAEARSRLRAGALVGVSTHNGAELAGALADGADYVGVGSLYPTATKGRFVPVGSPAALAPLAEGAEAGGVPAFGIGGLDVERAATAAAAGFQRLALCAGILAHRDPEAAARAIVAALSRRGGASAPS